MRRKLGLGPGMRLLDAGCGWGGLVLHAARHCGVRLLDYRDVSEGGFDAVSSVGLTEHVGRARLPEYFAFLHGKVRPQGRLLNHCITRPDSRYPLLLRNGFIDRFVFPDGELHGPGHFASAMHDAGFELRHEENLREHYARTVATWEANLSAH